VIATGSEVPLALAAGKRLAEEGIAVRVVSMPSTSVFDRQTEAYRGSVLPRHLPCVAVEAGVKDGWYKYVGREGRVIGMDRFGESAPAEAVYRTLGVTVENVVAALRAVLQ
jgi:transketolase